MGNGDAQLLLVIRTCISNLLEGITPENYQEIIQLILDNYVSGNQQVVLDDTKEGYIDTYKFLYGLRKTEFDKVKQNLSFFKRHYGNRDLFLGLKTICKTYGHGYGLISIPHFKTHLDNPFQDADQELLYEIFTKNIKYEITCMVR
jgi:hypothetical protein